MKGVSFMKKKNVCGLLLVGIVFSCLVFGRSVLANTGLYRLYHPGLQVHLYTQDNNEYQVLGTRGWRQEGLAWSTSPDQGEFVYRLYHPGLKVHLYTQDTNEYKVLGSRGWQQEGPAFRSHGKLPVHRLYHHSIKKHIYTKDYNEVYTLIDRGWDYEGIAFYAEQPAGVSVIPAEAVGTWTGSSPLAPEVSVTITADGQMKTYNHFVSAGLDEEVTATATIVELKTITPNTYIILGMTGEIKAALPGVTGIGFPYVLLPGFKIENGQYRPIACTGLTYETVDYINYTDFGFALTKQ